jgi:hypothetical protein
VPSPLEIGDLSSLACDDAGARRIFAQNPSLEYSQGPVGVSAGKDREQGRAAGQTARLPRHPDGHHRLRAVAAHPFRHLVDHGTRRHTPWQLKQVDPAMRTLAPLS